MNAQKTEASRYALSPQWIAKKEDSDHRANIRATAELDVSDDWLDDLEGEEA